MKYHVGFPAHHPAWPRWCNKCNSQAYGFSVSKDIGDKMAISLSGVACRQCRLIVIPKPAQLPPSEVNGAIFDCAWFGRRFNIEWLDKEVFIQDCCTERRV